MVKKHKVLFSILYLIISTGLFLAYIKYSPSTRFSYDLMMFFLIIDVFILCNFIIELKELYNFIYNKRYWLGFALLFILVAGKYNGSSTPIWDYVVQPGYQLKPSVIIGHTRPIRSDEWLVSTPASLSQASSTVKFATHNKVMGARDNLVMLEPNLPSKDISILAAPNKIGYFFFDVERAFSLAWYLPYFILFFASFEMFMILLKKDKLFSLLGAIMVTLAPAIQWWQSAVIPAYGSLAVVLFYYFLKSKKWQQKLLLSILFGYAGFLYIMCLYPAWQVTYGYVYLIILIWIIVNNKKDINKKTFLYLIPVFIVIAVPLAIILYSNREIFSIMSKTVYPGARDNSGGGADYITLLTYVTSIFYPYKTVGNPCELSQYTGFFPIPLFFSIYLMKKNKRKDLFLIMCSILMVFYCLWIFIPLPKIISKITLLYITTANRLQLVVSYLSLLMFIYILSNYREKIKKKTINKRRIIAGIISVVSVFIIVKLSNRTFHQSFPNYVTLKMSLTSLVVFSILVYYFIYNQKKDNVLLVILLVLLTISNGLFVSPLNKGLDVFYDKPLAKEIRKLVKKDKNAIFMSADKTHLTGNYLIVNGAKTIDSINYVPNLDLYHKLDPDLKYEDVYNRYEHIGVEVIDDEKTYFELVQHDYINMYINKKDVCKIGVDYLVTRDKELTDLGYKSIYNEYNSHIYKTECE